MTRRFFTLATLFVLLFGGFVTEAQETVALHFYIVPKIGDGQSIFTPFRPKYFRSAPFDDVTLPPMLGAMDYGKEDAMLVGAQVTSAQHTTIAANLDVTAIPLGLDDTISAAALVTVQAKLEALKIPAGWVTTSHTYRQVIGFVGRIFMLLQRFDGQQAQTFFASGITLDTRVNQLTASQRTAIQNAAASMGLDTSFVTGPMTIRQVFKTWADAMGPFTLAGETF